MWGGKAQVFERPSLVTDTDLSDAPVIFGSLIDSEICTHANVFIGRYSSTFTKNIIRHRKVLGYTESYNFEAPELTKAPLWW
jgi:hypothetical protein